ncbi:MAG: hypothetical protein QOJ74_1953 [Ilumatobacteraceae bacterium]|jgi:hypothetical protein|nr:hypothetical protein [Ilumatobacteraceae bacterium]
MCERCTGEDALPRRHFLRLAAAGALTVAAGTLFESRVAEAKPKPTPKPMTPAPAKFAAVPAPTIVTRAQWGADESIRDSHVVGWAPFRKIVVHHTASPNGTKDPAATVRFGYELHVVGRGFTDIGYNFLIGPDGEIFEGRRARKYGPHELHTGEDAVGNAIIGGHTKGRNPGSCGIALIGNFMKTSPSRAATESLIHLVSWEAQRHQIDPLGSDQYVTTASESLVFHNIAGHRDIGATLCPGTRMAASMGWLRNQVADRVGSFPARKADMRRLAWMLH